MRLSIRHTLARVAVIMLLAGFCVLGATTAASQVPNVQVYFDSTLTTVQADCGGAGQPIYLQVVANRFNMWMSAIEYSVILPPSLSYIAETTTAPVVIGNALAGVAMSWTVPQNAFDKLVVSEIIAVWNCNECFLPRPHNVQNQPLVVRPHPVSGAVRAVRWPDQKLFSGLGMTSIICEFAMPTEETSWGKVKALYR